MNFKAIILDFDGIVLESCDIKTKAFRELFKGYPDHVDRIVDYHLSHGGVSRYKKFEHFYGKILGKPLENEEIDRLGKEFSRLVLDEIKKCDFVPGAEKFLNDFSKKSDLYVASGTPDEELKSIVSARGLASFFRGVYGSPATKSEIIRKILSENDLEKKDVLFVGDSETDYREAIKAGMPFAFRTGSSASFKPDERFCLCMIEDLHGLKEFLENTW